MTTSMVASDTNKETIQAVKPTDASSSEDAVSEKHEGLTGASAETSVGATTTSPTCESASLAESMEPLCCAAREKDFGTCDTDMRSPERRSNSAERKAATRLLNSALHLSARADGSFSASYDVVDETPLASGAYAHVWRCRLRKATSGMLYVVKCIDRPRLHRIDKKNLFGADGRDGEIRLHSKIIHPNIVRLISVFEEPEVVSVVLECCAGGDLFEHIKAHKKSTGMSVSLAAAASCTRQLMSALTFLHSGNIVHRDVKSENIMLLETGLPLEQCTCKLGDFGFAVCLNQVKEGKLYTVLGSPSTVAPEVLSENSYGLPADLWSSGVVLFNLLTASYPFKVPAVSDRKHGGAMERMRNKAYNFEGRAWERIDDTARDLLRSLLCTKVDTRFRAPQALLHEFLYVPDVAPETPNRGESLRGRAPRACGIVGRGRSRDLGAKSNSPSNFSRSPPHISRSVTRDSIAEDISSAADSDFGLSDSQFFELGVPAQCLSSPSQRDRLPSSSASVATELSSPGDSEYGVSDWQINYAKSMTPVRNGGAETAIDSGQKGAGTPHKMSTLLLPPYATRQSRMTSAASDTTAPDSAFGLSEDQIEGAYKDTTKFKQASLDQQLLAEHTALAAQKELTENHGHQAALDVLGSRLQEVHPPSRESSLRVVDEEVEEQLEDEAEKEDDEDLSPFIYRKSFRKINDEYSLQFMDPAAEQSKSRAACCGVGPSSRRSTDRPWWQRWFF